MARITYLLGAGASAGSLPTVDKFDKEIEKVLTQLEICKKWYDLNVGIFDELHPLNMAISDLQMLKEGCERHRSVDTFAKMLFLTSDVKERAEKYKKVKCAIILFFELYRFENNNTDKRYDAFLATIINNKKPRFPNDINILSWNYDYEFERAYLNYSPERDNIHELHSDLNIIHKNNRSSNPLGNCFGILKINGTAGFYDSTGKLTLGLNCHLKQKVYVADKNHQSTLEICQKYHEFVCGDFEPAISFSWEDDNGHLKIANVIEDAMLNTQIFIIVGYSFPYFNREIDKLIINKIKYANTKIYIQDPNPEELKELIDEIKIGTNFQNKFSRSYSQFYINF